MTLAQALQEKKTLAARIASLWALLTTSSVVVTGETPEDNPVDISAELDRTYDLQERLTIKVNEVNNVTYVTTESGQLCIMHAIARRDQLKPRIQQLAGYITALRGRNRNRYGETEKNKDLVTGVNIKELQKKLDEMSQELRTLDNAIQTTNFTTNI